VNSDEGIDLLKKHSPDLIIVATFKQILKERILGLPSLGVVNVHPSLLPKYRGACPTNAVLDNDEKVTGVTFHYVTEELDNGDILLQRALPISETDNDGQLRQKLAQLAGRLIPELVGMFSGFSKPAGTPQDHALASFAPKPVVEDGYLEKAKDIQTIRKKIRAFNPIPGTSILVADQRIPINRFEIVQDSKPDGIYVNRDTIEWIIGPEAIRLFKNLEFQSS
jgi:methionyl-tRNA formyltransferase